MWMETFLAVEDMVQTSFRELKKKETQHKTN